MELHDRGVSPLRSFLESYWQHTILTVEGPGDRTTPGEMSRHPIPKPQTLFPFTLNPHLF